MKRKLAVVVAAIILPGGLLLLAATLVARALSRTEQGRKVIELAKSHAPRRGFPFIPQRAA